MHGVGAGIGVRADGCLCVDELYSATIAALQPVPRHARLVHSHDLHTAVVQMENYDGSHSAARITFSNCTHYWMFRGLGYAIE